MSFYQALSGLNAAARNLDVIGNNIANANTIGAKSSRTEFQDIYAAASDAGSGAVGGGVSARVIAQSFGQGNITSTGNPMDLAINGNGFFQLTDGNGSPVFSRNGQFKVDDSGYVVNNSNLKLMGYQAGLNGSIIAGLPAPIQLPTQGIAPVASTSLQLEFNTDSRVGRPSGLGPVVLPLQAADELIDTTDPTTYNNATSSKVYDVKGQAITLNYFFQKVTENTWNVYATANGESINGVTGEDHSAMRPIASLNYPASGGNPSAAGGGSITSYAWSAAGVATPSTVTNGIMGLPAIPAVALTSLAGGALSEPITGLTLNMGSATQYGSAFGVTRISADGNAPGNLIGFNIDAEGVLTSRYSNGQTQATAMIELANFRNPQGLQPIGGNAWAQTRYSGTPVMNSPGQGNLGVLQSGALEESNVELTAELVSMMTAQRAYQANAQTIKTQDQVMATLVNLR